MNWQVQRGFPGSISLSWFQAMPKCLEAASPARQLAAKEAEKARVAQAASEAARCSRFLSELSHFYMEVLVIKKESIKISRMKGSPYDSQGQGRPTAVISEARPYHEAQLRDQKLSAEYQLQSQEIWCFCSLHWLLASPFALPEKISFGCD